jgi:hypothetical protein
VAAIRKALCSLGLAPGTPPPADSSDHKSMLVAAAAAVSSEATKVRRGSPLHARRRSHSHRRIDADACLFKGAGSGESTPGQWRSGELRGERH